MTETKALTPERLGEVKAWLEGTLPECAELESDNKKAFCLMRDLLAAHDSLTAQLAELTEEAAGLQISSDNYLDAWHKANRKLDVRRQREMKIRELLGVDEFGDIGKAINDLRTQLAEARAEAAGYREALDRVRAINWNWGGPANRDKDGAWIVQPQFEELMLKRLNEALSTPPSHFARKVELMGAVVEAAKRLVSNERLNGVDIEARYRALEAALEAHEREGR